MAPLTNSSAAPINLDLPVLTDPSILRVRDTLSQISTLAARIISLRNRVPELSEEEHAELETDQKKLRNLKIMLRGFNREMYLQNRAAKQATSDAKAEVDNLSLSLQNLKYEQGHLRSEIQDCRSYAYPALKYRANFSTLYTDLDLISEDEFFALHPEFQGLEGHELMLKRLEDEAEQRVELETRRKDLVNRRTATQADSKKRKNDLDNLTETLKKFIEVLFDVMYLADDIECNPYLGSVSEVLRNLLTKESHGRGRGSLVKT